MENGNETSKPRGCWVCAVTMLFLGPNQCAWSEEAACSPCRPSPAPSWNLPLHLHPPRSNPSSAFTKCSFCSPAFRSWPGKAWRGSCCSLQRKGGVGNCGSGSKLSHSVAVTQLFTQSWFRHAFMLREPRTWRWKKSCPLSPSSNLCTWLSSLSREEAALGQSAQPSDLLHVLSSSCTAPWKCGGVIITRV